MTHYRARDVLLAPSLISLSRVVLAALFPWAASTPWAALGVLGLAGASDVLDGWVARRRGLVTATGAVVDAVADKLLAFTAVLTLLLRQALGVEALLLLSVRELGELPLVLWFMGSHTARAARVEDPRANAVGKAATVLQFGTIAAVLAGVHPLEPWFWCTALCGLVAAANYWRREFRPRA